MLQLQFIAYIWHLFAIATTSSPTNLNATCTIQAEAILEDSEGILWAYAILTQNAMIREILTFTAWNLEWLNLPDTFSNSLFFPQPQDFFQHFPFKMNGTFLEIGTGAGHYACKASLNGASFVVATDINPIAIQNVLLNAEKYNIDESKLVAFESDIFDSPRFDQYTFDIIFWNFPYSYLDLNNFKKTKKTLTYLEHSCFDPGWTKLHRFLSQAQTYLNKNGKLYIGWAKQVYNATDLLDFAKQYHWDIRLFEQVMVSTGLTSQVWELTPNR